MFTYDNFESLECPGSAQVDLHYLLCFWWRTLPRLRVRRVQASVCAAWCASCHLLGVAVCPVPSPLPPLFGVGALSVLSFLRWIHARKN